VALGQEMQMALGSLQVALAETAAAAHRNLRLHDLIAVAHRVALGVQKSLDALLLVRFEQFFPGEKNHGHGGAAQNSVNRKAQFHKDGHRHEDEPEHQAVPRSGCRRIRTKGSSVRRIGVPAA
jgi:hypothetical protein